MINSSEQEVAGLNHLVSSKGPVTPELGKQAANRGQFGLPTPDATPESRRAERSDHQRGFVRSVDQRATGIETPSVSSRAPSVEEITIHRDCSQQSIQREVPHQSSERPGSPPASEPQLHEEDYNSLSSVKAIFNLLISFLTLAKQRKS
ncbi:hypothetical protein F5Y08DRAFT_321964 [Xylaria arbuscula]|nr:hypothetical protein F5Y08DRAFT_321964 [Xylaria arbuscula]